MKKNITQLNVPNSMAQYAELHGAIHDKTIGWHVVGNIPIELDDFVIKAPRSAGSTWTVQCPKCGGQMELKQSKKSEPFWGCMSFPTCRGTRSVDAIVTAQKTTRPPRATSTPAPVDALIMAELVELTLQALKSPHKIKPWLNSPKFTLGGKTPIELLQEDPKNIEKIRMLLLHLYD